MNKSIVVVGGGAFGTALALSCLRANAEVTLIPRDSQTAQTLRKERENPKYLPNIVLPDALSITSSFDSLSSATLVLLAIPAQSTIMAISRFKEALPSHVPLILCAKGIHLERLELLSHVVRSVCPNPLGVLSGPSFAIDIAQEKPVAVILAAETLSLAESLASTLRHSRFRCYASDDMVGVQLGGAIKNIIAIGSGVVDGLGYGKSAQAALLSRGLVEMIRLGVAMGGREQTFMGLSGVGDLILTGSSETSRNYALGKALGLGGSLSAILQGTHSVTEGVATCDAIYAKARALKVRTPLLDSIHALLHAPTEEEGISSRSYMYSVIEGLLSRQSSKEY